MNPAIKTHSHFWRTRDGDEGSPLNGSQRAQRRAPGHSGPGMALCSSLPKTVRLHEKEDFRIHWGPFCTERFTSETDYEGVPLLDSARASSGIFSMGPAILDASM
jgi:hypothetical protein